MELLRGDQTTRRGVRLACGVIALATLALAACNDNNQTGPIGANTLVFVGTVNGANATLSGSVVLTIDETRVAATFKIRAPSADAGTAANETGTASGIAPGDVGTATGTQTSTTLQDTSEAWTKAEWAAHTVVIAAGTGAGQTRTVSSNSENILTVSPAWTKTPDGTSQYLIETTIAITGTYSTSSKAFSATGGGYTFDGAYDGSSRLQGTFTGPSSVSGTFLTERATNGPKAYCGTFTSTTAGDNGIFNVTLHGAILFGTSTADAGAVLPLDGTVSGSGVTVVNPNAPTGPPLAIGTVSTDGSSVAGTFDDGAGNMGNWQGARCDL